MEVGRESIVIPYSLGVVPVDFHVVPRHEVEGVDVVGSHFVPVSVAVAVLVVADESAGDDCTVVVAVVIDEKGRNLPQPTLVLPFWKDLK